MLFLGLNYGNRCNQENIPLLTGENEKGESIQMMKFSLGWEMFGIENFVTFGF